MDLTLFADRERWNKPWFLCHRGFSRKWLELALTHEIESLSGVLIDWLNSLKKLITIIHPKKNRKRYLWCRSSISHLMRLISVKSPYGSRWGCSSQGGITSSHEILKLGTSSVPTTADSIASVENNISYPESPLLPLGRVALISFSLRVSNLYIT